MFAVLKRFKTLLVLVLLALSTQCLSTNDDTVTTKIDAGSSRSIIVNQLFLSFSSGEFDNLAPFCGQSVTLCYYDSTGSKQEPLTEWGTICKLNRLFKNLPYERFKILSVVDKPEILLVKVYMSAEDEKALLHIYIVMNSSFAIESVSIYLQY